MPRAAQADQPAFFDGPELRALPGVALLCAVTMLTGCGAGGFSLEKAEVDRSLYTSSAPSTAGTFDAERFSDEATIRNAVTSADLETLGEAPLLWANAGTGARGQIMGIAEKKAPGTLCRQFSATRESFDGVAMFRGEACMVGTSGSWRMTSFEPATSGISS
ncbi:RT0821/Lpp0805 family surface protein [Mesorhizobium sp. VNQ89]|uniref:RT0821/Lpp0805 family surface protein n=1 Tax=Mesorhizobium quangtriensis TaxID=3157709 RepID=UPI0032B6FD43